MPRKSMRKLVDIHVPAVRLQNALERFLQAHSINFSKVKHAGDVYRYRVAAGDRNAAEAVLPALYDMSQGGPDVA